MFLDDVFYLFVHVVNCPIEVFVGLDNWLVAVIGDK